MKQDTILTATLVSLLFLGACNPTPETTEETTETVVTENSTMEADEEATSPADLVLFTSMTNHMQTQLSLMATDKSNSPAVREVSEEIASQNTEILSKIQELGKTLEMDLPMTLTVDQQAIYDSLQELSPEAFDQAYVEVLHEDLEKNLENLEGLAAQSDSEIIRGLAADIVDLQQPQIEKIEQLQQEMM